MSYNPGLGVEFSFSKMFIGMEVNVVVHAWSDFHNIDIEYYDSVDCVF